MKRGDQRVAGSFSKADRFGWAISGERHYVARFQIVGAEQGQGQEIGLWGGGRGAGIVVVGGHRVAGMPHDRPVLVDRPVRLSNPLLPELPGRLSLSPPDSLSGGSHGLIGQNTVPCRPPG
jgi:hypothetical protein